MQDRTDQSITEQAAHWMTRLHAPDFGKAEYDEFRLWLAADQRHREEFAAISVLWDSMEQITDPDRRDHISHTIADITPALQRRTFGYRHWISATVGLAGCVTLFLLVSPTWLGSMLGDSSYVTGVGEKQTVTLTDGSTVYLNTRTELNWSADRASRSVELADGEAFFDVASDPNRPFEVRTGQAVIRAIGTQFNVYRKNHADVQVTVLEGVVEVEGTSLGDGNPKWQRTLIANQEIIYRDIGVASEVRIVDAAKQIAWRDSVFIMEDTPLVDLVRELNRYSTRPIVIGDTELEDIRLGGVIIIVDTSAALEFLKTTVDLHVLVRPESYVLHSSSVL